MVDTRLPRTGVGRRWMLLGEKTRMAIVALAAIVIFAIITGVFNSDPAPPPAPLVSHSMSQGKFGQQ